MRTSYDSRMGDRDGAFREFIERAKASGGSELGNAQSFILGLCDHLRLPKPDFGGPRNELNDHVFERSVTFKHPDGSTSGGRIDLYKRGCFILEAKQSSKREAPSLPLPLISEDEAQPKLGHAAPGTRRWDRVMMEARKQAESYARALPVEHGYPPFILVLDVGNVLEVFADFSGQGKNYAHFPDRRSYRLTMDDLLREEVQDRLRAIWERPFSLDPARVSAEVTRDVALRLATVARRLEAKHGAQTVAEFLMRCIFTMFAEDAGLLPDKAFENLLHRMLKTPQHFAPALEDLWSRMDLGGYWSGEHAVIRRFNGSLFKDRTALPLGAEEIGELLVAARREWRDVEPAIFGTLLERALDARERSKLGAHYTPRAYVERLVVPTIIEPLRAEWDTVSARVQDLLAEGKPRDALNEARRFHRKLCATRVLDPACGTGNFLYVSFELMKRLEGEVLEMIADLGGEPDRYGDFPDEVAGRVGRKLAQSGGRFSVDPHQFHGLELNERAVPIADLVLWIGFLKWQIRTAGPDSISDPVLDAYGTIVKQDAILTWDEARPALDAAGRPLTRWDGVTRRPDPVTGEPAPDPAARVPRLDYVKPRKAPWPEVEFIVGNPPFIGGKDMRAELGDGYAEACWQVRPEIPGGADFVMHFWDAAAERLARKGAKERPNPLRRFGFITTNSITQTFSRRVVEARLADDPPISLVYAVPDHPWLKAADKAAVRIAMTVAERGAHEGVLAEVVSEAGLDTDAPRVELRRAAGKVKAKLTLGADVTKAAPLWSNEAISSPGVKLHGSGFIVTPQKAAALGLGRVPGLERHILPYRNGRDLAGRPRGVMVIDLFGLSAEAVRDQFPSVYQHLLETVRPEREAKVGGSKDLAEYARKWWEFGKPRSELRQSISNLPRFLSTVETSKHRFFQFLDASIRPDNMLVNIGLEAGWALAILSSRASVRWSLEIGGTLEDRPRYNKTRTFDPFPFPILSPTVAARLSALGDRLDAMRKERIAAHPHLTMTGLYNALERVRELAAGAGVPPPSDAERDVVEAGHVHILRELHDEIDRAVLDAYGWSDLAPDLVGKPGGTAPSLHKSAAQEAAEEALLTRLVALNRERARAEALGDIRWLRPGYQIPKLKGRAPEPKLDVETETPIAAAVDETPKWPTDGLEQFILVRDVLARADAPLSPREVALRFTGGRNRADRIARVLARMAETGLVRGDPRAGGERYFVPR